MRVQPKGADAQTALEATNMRVGWKSALFFLALFITIFVLLVLLG
jgi:hypothetical protein